MLGGRVASSAADPFGWARLCGVSRGWAVGGVPPGQAPAPSEAAVHGAPERRPRRATASLVETLVGPRRRRVNATDGGGAVGRVNATEGVCAICLGDLRSPRGLPCGHRFCRDCLGGWLAVGETCPVCRQVARPLRRLLRRAMALVGPYISTFLLGTMFGAYAYLLWFIARQVHDETTITIAVVASSAGPWR